MMLRLPTEKEKERARKQFETWTGCRLDGGRPRKKPKRPKRFRGKLPMRLKVEHQEDSGRSSDAEDGDGVEIGRLGTVHGVGIDRTAEGEDNSQCDRKIEVNKTSAETVPGGTDEDRSANKDRKECQTDV